MSTIKSIPDWLTKPTRFMFFTGKGGVGKTSLSTATAIYLADNGKQVLLVSTDAASNLDVMLNITLSNHPIPVPGVPGLEVLNIDPEEAVEAYRQRVIEQMPARTSDEEKAAVIEQLSGACTTEIASFDEFSSLLAAESCRYDHVIFDTAPSGHTLRLLSLPKAWSGFLAGNDKGASCLGPHSGLKMQETRFNLALGALSDPALTSVELITRPDVGALAEAARTSEELKRLGLLNQRLIINGVFRASTQTDAVASAIERQGQSAMTQMPEVLRYLPCDEVPLRALGNVGLPALRALLTDTPAHSLPYTVPSHQMTALKMKDLVDELSVQDHGLIMVMGKGGVGKTTIAAALALSLVARGKTVHLSTTDPAAHLTQTLGAQVSSMEISRIDPKVETQKYIDKIMASKGAALDENEKALLLEDLQSPCTEEVAVFHAFSHIVAQARSGFVVLDTAPTGHSLLLMDAAGAYHRQMMMSSREYAGKSTKIITPLMRLQDANYTRIILVTLPEATPVLQAAALQADLRRAQIEPYAWIMNQSILAAGTQDPLLVARIEEEVQQMKKIQKLTQKVFVIPFSVAPPIGLKALQQLSNDPL